MPGEANTAILQYSGRKQLTRFEFELNWGAMEQDTELIVSLISRIREKANHYVDAASKAFCRCMAISCAL